jgi:SseB protein N-terminal domain
MTPLDQAFQQLHDDPENIENRHHFYSLFLQTTFFVPTFDQASADLIRGEGAPEDPEKTLPLVMEADGNNFMMLFDQEARVTAWAGEELKCLTLPGFVAIAMATEELHLALNVGSDYSKQFVPEEIAWLKQVVKQSSAAGDE